MSDATIRLQFPSPAAANRARDAIAPDNGGFIDATVDGSVLVIAARSDSTMGLLRSLDDVLGCLRATGMD